MKLCVCVLRPLMDVKGDTEGEREKRVHDFKLYIDENKERLKGNSIVSHDPLLLFKELISLFHQLLSLILGYI